MKSDKAPGSFGIKLYIRQGKTISLIDSSLLVKKLGKAADFKVINSEIAYLEQGKHHFFFNASGEEIFRTDERIDYSADGTYILINSKDTSFYIDSKGNKTGYRERESIARNRDPENNTLKVFNMGNLYGIKLHNKVILEPVHEGLSVLNNKELLVKFSTVNRLYSEELKEIISRDFDHLYLFNECMMVKSGIRYYYYNLSGDPIVIRN